ncbi:MAG: sugar phosphate isomerase/epimerase family protein [Bryobacteraceae bacterium]
MLGRRELLALLPAAALAAKKARLRTAICAYSFRQALQSKSMTYDDLVRLAVDVGADGLDVTVYWFPSTEDSFLMPLRGLAYRHGVELYSIAVRTEMCRPTVEMREKEINEVRKWVDVAAKLGAGHIRVFGGTVPKGESEDTAAGWVVEILKRASEYAGAKGVILGLENHGGITARAERILDIVTKVNSRWVAVNLDTGNFSTNAYQQIETMVPYAANVQFKSEVRDDKGQRVESDWDRIVAMLAKGGYQGYLSLEYEAREDPVAAMPRLIGKLNQLARKHSG